MIPDETPITVARRPPWLGVLATTLVLTGAVTWRHGFDGAVLGAAAIAAALGLLLGRGRAQPPAPADEATEAAPSTAEALLANIPDPVILVDRRAVVIEVNPAARQLLPALRLRHPLSFALRAPDVLDGIEEVLRTGLPLKTTFVTRVPVERVFEVQIGALPMDEMRAGGDTDIVLFLRDLTSAHRLEAMRADFVANASHELRTPLSSLLGFIETLQGPARDDAAARERFLVIMRTQAQRMSRLIDDLLSLSRIELREHVAPTQAIDLGQIARQMVDLQAPLAAERGVSIVLDAPDTGYPVLGDRDELARVIENLVENAVKYGGEGRLVTVALARGQAGGWLELSVTDHGPGIAPEHIPRLTERFYRVDVASSRQKGGTGLGLAIVKHALNRHRGRLVIESTLRLGTTARIVLPERTAEALPEPGSEPATGGP